ncbi:hypothetical protein [Actinomadura oligospora]|uniref:hypothetical protein n=1 Tax=Actinomadura oligospora TaxID=111804 RepID=UPI0004B0A716|nr:hypothetical protein [Actinomadura oligospora]
MNRSGNNLLFEEIRAEGRAEGRIVGRMEVLLDLLAAKGFELSEADRTRVVSCSDTATLQRWLVRAVRAGSLDEVFGEG